MIISAWCHTYKKEIHFGGGGFLLALILLALFFYTPRPTLIDPPRSTKEAKISLKGKVSPRMSVAVFDGSGNAIVIVNANEKGEFTLNDIQIGEGKNTLRLRTIASKWRASFPLVLLIEKDTTAPVLSMNSLRGTTVTGSNTVISGKAESGSVVTVNGVRATVNPDGTWSATVAMQPGANMVTVASTDAAGNTTTQTQTVQYVPSAQDSQTGTATVTSSTTATSPGSQPAQTATSTTSGSPTSSTSTGVTPATTTPTQLAPTAAPAPQPVLAIVATVWVSNSSPNSRANETIYASVKDNHGRAVTNASVIAAVYYKSGAQNYSLTHQGNGTYAVSFKLNDKYVSGYRVGVDVTARFNGFVSTAATAFTPL